MLNCGVILITSCDVRMSLLIINYFFIVLLVLISVTFNLQQSIGHNYEYKLENLKIIFNHTRNDNVNTKYCK